MRGSLPPLNFGEQAGKNISSSSFSACSPAYFPKPKRIATSTSSRVKSVSAFVESNSRSNSGCFSINLPTRGVTKRAENDDSIDTTRRRSRSPARTWRVASASVTSAARTCGRVLAAAVGEAHALAVAGEQRHAELGFERAHLVADGAMRDEEFVGGAREAFVARGGFEGAQRVEGGELAEVHGSLT